MATLSFLGNSPCCFPPLSPSSSSPLKTLYINPIPLPLPHCQQKQQQTLPYCCNSLFIDMEEVVDIVVDFEDYFPSMMERYGAEGLVMELCNGFRLLMDGERGLITFESLKTKSMVLGLSDLKDEEIVCMLSEGDLDGDGALNQAEFCILMFRLSPGLLMYAQ